MRKIIYGLILGGLWLSACGGSTSRAPAATERVEVVSGSSTPAIALPTETVVHEVKTDFVATDPGMVQLAAGKPQLVEFFAVW